MTVLANIARKEPDLKRELRLVIEQHVPHGSTGFHARVKKVMKKMGPD